MTSVSRRSLLAGVSSAVAVAAPVVPHAAQIGVAPLAGSVTVGESPELLQMGVDLVEAVKRLENAKEALEQARERALAMAPAIPEGLPVPVNLSIFGGLSWGFLPEPTNILGERIELPPFVSPKGKALPVRVPRSIDILNDRRKAGRVGIAEWERGEHRRLYDLAVQFERETDEAHEASGLTDAEWEHHYAGAAIVELCRRSTALDARTLEGALIKAQAIRACSRVEEPTARHVERFATDLLPLAICATGARSSA